MTIDEHDAYDHCNCLAADEEDVVDDDDDCDYYAFESEHDLENDDYFGLLWIFHIFFILTIE